MEHVFKDKDGDTLEIRTASANTPDARILLIAHQHRNLGGEHREARLIFSQDEAIRIRDHLIERFPLAEPETPVAMSVVGELAEFPGSQGVTINISTLNVSVAQ